MCRVEAARLAYNGNGIKDRDVRKDENILDEAYVRVYDDVEDFYWGVSVSRERT